MPTTITLTLKAATPNSIEFVWGVVHDGTNGASVFINPEKVFVVDGKPVADVALQPNGGNVSLAKNVITTDLSKVAQWRVPYPPPYIVTIIVWQGVSGAILNKQFKSWLLGIDGTSVEVSTPSYIKLSKPRPV